MPLNKTADPKARRTAAPEAEKHWKVKASFLGSWQEPLARLADSYLRKELCDAA